MTATYDYSCFGPLAPLMNDPTVLEIMVDGPHQVYVERKGKLEDVDIQFKDDEHLMAFIHGLLELPGGEIDEANPMADFRLADGTLMNVIIPPLALNGPILTIRKFFEDPLTIDDLIRFGSISSETAQFLKACVAARLNILISGGTGSGKTTVLNVMASFIPEGERIITVEKLAELQLKHRRVVRLETRPPNREGKGEVTIRDLLHNALKMRPDRIIMGEVRGGEIMDMIQAMNTGHDGSMTVIHANSPRDALVRLEAMTSMDNPSIPVLTMREMTVSAIDLIVQQIRLRDGSRKVVKVTEVQGMQGDLPMLVDIFVFEQQGMADGKIIGRLKPTGIRPKFLERIKARNLPLPPNIFGLPAAQKKIQVLVVDDVEETRENIRKLLYFESDIVVIGLAANGEEGIKLAREHKPDIVLMDLLMPGIDGIAATQTITQELPATQVIVMSAKGEADHRQQAEQAGAREYLVKPFASTDLISAIRQVYEAGR